MIKRVLGLNPEIEVLSAVNYQKLTLNAEDAIASLEFDTKIYSLEEINEMVKNSSKKVLFAPKNDYFETMPSYYVNAAIEDEEELIYIDSFKDGYKILKVLKVT